MPKIAHIAQFMSTNGDGTGTINAASDYSSAATNFYIQPPANEIYHIARLIVTIRDVGAMDADKYGNNITLTNGIEVQYREGGTDIVTDFTAGQPILTNSDWARYCYDVNDLAFGIGDEFLVVRWTFAKSRVPIVLKGDESDDLRVILNDNFSGLTEHYFMVQGIKGLSGYSQEYYE